MKILDLENLLSNWPEDTEVSFSVDGYIAELKSIENMIQFGIERGDLSPPVTKIVFRLHRRGDTTGMR